MHPKPSGDYTSAWPLLWLYLLLVVYASWYPLTNWEDRGIIPWDFLFLPLPEYWTGFDIWTNIAGYIPLGFLASLAIVRRGHRMIVGWVMAFLLGTGLSLLMEMGQTWLPGRIPSNLDWALNTLGTIAGALLGWGMIRTGVMTHWGLFRETWFIRGSRGGLVLLWMWPVALLFPAPLPFGLGQIWERLGTWVSRNLQNPSFEYYTSWWSTVAPIPSAQGARALWIEGFCVAISLLAPLLLGYSIIAHGLRRFAFMLTFWLGAIAMTMLSAALRYGPDYALVWLTPATQTGILAALIAGMLALVAGRRLLWVLMLIFLPSMLILLNQAPVTPYFAHTLQTWETGRFIHFFGLAQWMGWVWPYACIFWVASRLCAGPSQAWR